MVPGGGVAAERRAAPPARLVPGDGFAAERRAAMPARLARGAAGKHGAGRRRRR